MRTRGISCEITRHKKTEEAPGENQERYSALFENTHQAIILSGADGRVISANPAAAALLGYKDPKEMLSMPIADAYTDPALREAFLLELMAKGCAQDFENTLLKQDGSGTQVHVLVNATPHRDQKGRILWVETLFTDITERKRAEEELRRGRDHLQQLVAEERAELRKSHEQLQEEITKRMRMESELNSIYHVLDSSANGLIVVSLEEEIKYVNPTFLRMFGYKDRSQVLGRNAGDLFVGETERPFAEVTPSTDQKRGETKDLLARRKDGTQFSVRVSSSVVADEENNANGIIALVADITYLQQAKEERRRLAAELAQKNNELEQILYVTSHDLRSPLVNIQGFSKELDNSLKELSSILQHKDIPADVGKQVACLMDEDILASMHYIRTSTAKMNSLLSGLLRLSRLGHADIKMKDLDMNELISIVVSEIEFRIKEAEVKLEISELPPCRGDLMQINLVFSNLLENALKYLDLSRPGIIRISGHEEEDHSVYCVADNGIGIAPEHQKRIFEVFHQINPAAGNGEGLGLAIVSRIVDTHWGKVWVKSEPGKGSQFFVSLPGASNF